MKTNESPEADRVSDDPHHAQVERARDMLGTDPAKGLAELKSLADQGSGAAMIHVARAYQQGLGTPVDLAEAVEWYRQALTRDTQPALAGLTEVAQLYVQRHEFARARATLLLSLDVGVPPPLDLLTNINRWELWTREPDYPRFQRAFDAMKTNRPWALGEFQALAELGSPISMQMLGRMYALGWGTPADMDLAMTWYRRAQERGDWRSPFFLGWIYLQRADYEKAFEAFTAGAALDHAPALYALGGLYRRGLGVAKQRKKARALFERAAALGHLFAKRDLALLRLRHGGFRQRLHAFRLLCSSIKDISRALQQEPHSERLHGQIVVFHIEASPFFRSTQK